MSDSEEKHAGSESLKKDVNNGSHQQQEGSTTVLTVGEKEMSSFKEEDTILNSESYQQQEGTNDVNAGRNQELQQGSATILTAGENSQENISQDTSSFDVEDDMNSEGGQEVVEEEDDDWFEDQGNGWATVKRARKEDSIRELSQEMFSSEQDDNADGWENVLSSDGKKLRELVQYEEQEGTTDWSPVDVNTTPEQESDLMQLMETAIEKLEKSEYLRVFMDQLQSIQASEDHFSLLTGSEEKLKVVIYGIGSIESYEHSRLQLSLVINMKKHLDWMGEVEVFDPAISLTELKVIEKLGCSVLSVNEYGRREAVSPTFFFMPHCVFELYVNLLKTNWMLRKVTPD